MEQGNLAFSANANEEISDALILNCKTLRQALRLCIEVSGHELKDIAFQLNLLENHLSRMLSDNPEDKRHFPPDLISTLMDVCRNEIPLRWQALRRGYGLHRLRSAVELENEFLKAEIEQREKEMEVVKNFLRGVKL